MQYYSITDYTVQQHTDAGWCSSSWEWKWQVRCMIYRQFCAYECLPSVLRRTLNYWRWWTLLRLQIYYYLIFLSAKSCFFFPIPSQFVFKSMCSGDQCRPEQLAVFCSIKRPNQRPVENNKYKFLILNQIKLKQPNEKRSSFSMTVISGRNRQGLQRLCLHALKRCANMISD